MHEVFEQLKNEVKQVSSQMRPKFYEYFAPELAYVREFFFESPLVQRCAEDVLPFLADEFGHGIEHSKRVALDGGTIVLAEVRTADYNWARHMVLLVQLAALLHDVCRMEPEHAIEGSAMAERILKDFPLSDKDIAIISFAIRNHEAFKPEMEPPNFDFALISGALYDADKFRWGPDNFVTTMWEICDNQEWTLQKVKTLFPKAMEIINSISETFRTSVGRNYGPEFIQIGMELGNYIYRRIKQLSSQA